MARYLKDGKIHCLHNARGRKKRGAPRDRCTSLDEVKDSRGSFKMLIDSEGRARDNVLSDAWTIVAMAWINRSRLKVYHLEVACARFCSSPRSWLVCQLVVQFDSINIAQLQRQPLVQ